MSRRPPISAPFDYTGDNSRHTYQNGFGFYVQDAYPHEPRA